MAEEVAGSFAFPPMHFDSVDDYLAFFQNAPISDRLLSNADYAYRQWRSRALNAAIDQAVQAHQADPAVARMFQKHRDKWAADMAATRAQAEADATAKLPGASISEARLRDVIRAHQMLYFRRYVEEHGADAEQKVFDYVLPGDHETVQHLANRFHSGGWAPKAMTDSDLPAVDAAQQAAAASQQVAAAIADMTNRLSSQLGQMTTIAQNTDHNMLVAAENLERMR